MAVGFVRPLATTESVNPDGTVAALLMRVLVDVTISIAIDTTKPRESIELLEFMTPPQNRLFSGAGGLGREARDSAMILFQKFGNASTLYV
jgi:hypothetical protein